MHRPQSQVEAACSEQSSRHCSTRVGSMTVYVIVQLKMTDRAAYDRYQARFLDVFKKFSGRLLSADEGPVVLEGACDRDKLVLMSVPDEAAVHDSASFG